MKSLNIEVELLPTTELVQDAVQREPTWTLTEIPVEQIGNWREDHKRVLETQHQAYLAEVQRMKDETKSKLDQVYDNNGKMNLQLKLSKLEQAEIDYRKTIPGDALFEGYKPKHTTGQWDVENTAMKIYRETGDIINETEDAPKLSEKWKKKVYNAFYNLISSAFDKTHEQK